MRIFFLVVFITTLLSSCSSNPAIDVYSLEKIFPELEKNKIFAYRFDDWCKVLQYGENNGYATNPKSSCIWPLTSYKVEPFSTEARMILEHIHFSLGWNRPNVVIISNIKYSNNKISYAEFHLGTAFSREKYVYKPLYEILPEDLPHERWHTAVNKDWYYVLEDWN